MGALPLTYYYCCADVMIAFICEDERWFVCNVNVLKP